MTLFSGQVGPHIIPVMLEELALANWANEECHLLKDWSCACLGLVMKLRGQITCLWRSLSAAESLLSECPGHPNGSCVT